MKRFGQIGKTLTKAEQKSVMGGKGKMFCSCLGSGSAMDVVVCGFQTFQGGVSCFSGAQNYCSSTYGGATECSITYQFD